MNKVKSTIKTIIPEEISARLKAYFPEDELEWRVQQAGKTASGKPYAMVLCYVQARAIENRLDEVVGFENWQNEIRVEGDNIIARLGVRIGGDWVWKENGASQTEIEAFKGGISGAIKRVASSGFGIGRYLYELPATFAECSLDKMEGWNVAKLKTGERYWWKTPRMPAEFLPKADRQLLAADEAKGMQEWAENVDKAAFSVALAAWGIKSLTELEYAQRNRFERLFSRISKAMKGDEEDNGKES